MNPYSSYDYLCNEPFYIDGIGTIKCPTLRDIRKITFSVFSLYQNLLTLPLKDCLSMIRRTDLDSVTSDNKNEPLTLFHILLYESPQLLIGLLSFFMDGKITFEPLSASFLIYEDAKQTEQQPVGRINADNFERFRDEVQLILGLKKSEEKEPQFKNELARKMFEKLKTNSKNQSKKTDENFTFDNMIQKYCTHNKVGINILNVWDMTYYQFIVMFNEYCNGRQYDFNDHMAANTFSYKKSSDYKPMDYMKKIN